MLGKGRDERQEGERESVCVCAFTFLINFVWSEAMAMTSSNLFCIEWGLPMTSLNDVIVDTPKF